MFVESSSMATKLDEVDLELCLSLGGSFKKTKPKENLTDVESNGAKDISVDLNSVTMKREINATKRKTVEATEQQRNGEDGESKRIRIESNGVTNGIELDLKFSKGVNGYGSDQFMDINTNGSPVSKSSSSDVSDPSSSFHQQGGSCDVGGISGCTKPVNKISTGIEETEKRTDGSNDAVVEVVAKESGKPPKPRFNGNVNESRLLPFAKMPCVTSTGPEGKTVNGFLNQYSKSEISIICVCHGRSFSPAEFIIHAGGTNVSHPLRHITVVPSKF